MQTTHRYIFNTYGNIHPFKAENAEILKQMMSFHRDPSVLQFDSIIKLDMPMFVDMPMFRTHKPRAIMSSPVVLSWVHASVQRFPWLLEQSQYTAYIERAYNFTERNYYDKYINITETGETDSCYYNAHKIIEILLVKFGASGDTTYIDKARNISRGFSELEQRIELLII